MNKTDPIIRTKLRLPFTRPGCILRPRLQGQITQGLEGPLTLVTAPAGFGKTTLVASSVANYGKPVAWLSIDQDDNQAGRFLSYLVAAVQAADPTIGSEAGQLVAEIQPASSEEILTSLINELDIAGREIVLVLDDYQFISSQAVHSALAFLLEHIPRPLHLLIASRSDPPLPLVRFRARGQMVELRAADLSFTEPEAAQFLNDVMGLRLDCKAVAMLEERTEGWAAGLQMAALSMRDRKDIDGFIEGFSGTNRYILDYLLEEVLASQPPAIQHFLLRTSILKRLSAPLCDALWVENDELRGNVGDLSTSPESFLPGESATTLDFLEKSNLFLIPLDDERRWYRYHHLFAELLQARLNQFGPGLAARLQSRASRWCDREGQANDAVGYALSAGDYSLAAELIGKYWGYIISKGEIDTVWSWLNSLPVESVRDNAMLEVGFCWALWLRAQISEIEPHVQNAERALNRLKDTSGFSLDSPDYNRLSAHVAVLRSIIARYRSDFEAAVEFAETAHRLGHENLSPEENTELHSLIYLALGSAYDGIGDLEKSVSAYANSIHFSRLVSSATGIGITIRMMEGLRLLGRLREAEKACRDALKYIEERGITRLPTSGILYLGMADVLLERDKLTEAEEYISRGIEVGKRSGRFDAVLNAAPTLARLRLARCDPAGAMAAVLAAEAVMGERNPPLSRAEQLALKARVLLRQGALAEAAQCVEEAYRQAGRDQGQTRERINLAAIRVRLVQDKPAAAIEMMTQYISAAEAACRLGAVLEMRILRSLAFARAGSTSQAEDDLERALALAEPEGYLRIFIDEGKPMQLLLAQWLAHANASPLRDYAIHLVSRFEAERQAQPLTQKKAAPVAGLVEQLSQRELEVLQLLALGRTNQEVAGQLFVSPGTVKAHTASIYRKLDVANRTEAVARARQLGILS